MLTTRIQLASASPPAAHENAMALLQFLPGRKNRLSILKRWFPDFPRVEAGSPAGRKAIMKRYTTALLTAIAQEYRKSPHTHTKKNIIHNNNDTNNRNTYANVR